MPDKNPAKPADALSLKDNSSPSSLSSKSPVSATPLAASNIPITAARGKNTRPPILAAVPATLPATLAPFFKLFLTTEPVFTLFFFKSLSV